LLAQHSEHVGADERSEEKADGHRHCKSPLDVLITPYKEYSHEELKKENEYDRITDPEGDTDERNGDESASKTEERFAEKCCAHDESGK